MSIVFARRKTLVCLVVALNLVAARAVAIAASGPTSPTQAQATPSPLQAAATSSLLDTPARSLPLQAPGPSSPLQGRAARRPPALVPLYVSLASLQVADVASTLKALDNGTGVEANPIMRGVIGSPTGVIALKAGFTGLTIFASEKIWKRNRAAAILMMVGMNGAYAAVVAHNYSVARP